MNFSAQGYALLNEKLAPDIAVLEGGYSIEKALPYVNVGIILAMAGIDYSHVREPDYDAGRIRQSPDVTRLIEQEVKNLMTLWKKKKNLKKQITGSAAYVRRERIFTTIRTRLWKNKSRPSAYVMTAAGW